MNHDDFLDEDAYGPAQEIEDLAKIIGLIALITAGLVLTWILYFITS